MIVRRSARIAAWVLVVGLTTGIAAQEAEAAKKKAVLSARIGGKPFKVNRRLISASYGDLILIVGGGARKGKTVRSIAIGCVPLDLATATLPFDCPSGANGNYQEVSFRRPPSVRGWLTLDGMKVTIDYYDGVRIRGRFAGTFEIGNTADGQPLPPLTVENGVFDLPLGRQ